MARGVSENFLKLARREERLGKRALVVAALLALPAGFLADLADAPGYGPTWMLFLGAIAAGLLGGLALTHRKLTHYEDDLRVQWNHWMRHAVNAQRLSDVEAKTHERDPWPPLLASAGTVALLVVNVLLFALLWIAHPLAGGAAALVILTDGLVLGALAASSALLARWSRDFVRSAEDLVERGELPIWGER